MKFYLGLSSPGSLSTSSAHTIQTSILSDLYIRTILANPVHRDALRDAVQQAISGDFQSGLKPRESAIRLRPGLRILLAEDNAVNQKVASLMLDRQGASVYIANNGVEALQAIQAQPFDAILMDCQMPDMDGYEATRTIRKLEPDSGRKSIPIIALTANVLSDAKSTCLAAGMDDYLNKPPIMSQLVETLNRVTNSQ